MISFSLHVNTFIPTGGPNAYLKNFLKNLIVSTVILSSLKLVPYGKDELSTAIIFFFNQKYCSVETYSKVSAHAGCQFNVVEGFLVCFVFRRDFQ